MGVEGDPRFPEDAVAPTGLLAGPPGATRVHHRFTSKQLPDLMARMLASQQRAAKQVLNRFQKLKLYGEGAEEAPLGHDKVVVQMLFEVRKEVRRLDEFLSANITTDEAIAASNAKVKALVQSAALVQAALAEVNKITANTAKALIEAQKLELTRKHLGESLDDIPDAELEA